MPVGCAVILPVGLGLASLLPEEDLDSAPELDELWLGVQVEGVGLMLGNEGVYREVGVVVNVHDGVGVQVVRVREGVGERWDGVWLKDEVLVPVRAGVADGVWLCDFVGGEGVADAVGVPLTASESVAVGEKEARVGVGWGESEALHVDVAVGVDVPLALFDGLEEKVRVKVGVGVSVPPLLDVRLSVPV